MARGVRRKGTESSSAESNEVHSLVNPVLIS